LPALQFSNNESRRLYACGLAAMAATAAVRLRGCFRGCSFLHLEAQAKSQSEEPKKISFSSDKNKYAIVRDYQFVIDYCYDMLS